MPRPRVLRALAQLAENLPTRGNKTDLFFHGNSLFDQMIRDIDEARERIVMEMYTFNADVTGRRVARALSKAAGRGVSVRIIYDSVGSWDVPRSFFDVMVEAGIEAIEYHPIAPWRQRFALLERNHRKTLIVDGRVGYTGGVNIADAWIDPPAGAGWRDSHARIEGPAAGDLETLFIETWYRHTGVQLDLPRRIPREANPRTPVDEFGSQIYVIGRRGGLDRPMRRLYLLALGRARHSVAITSAYLVPDRKVRRALRSACVRGVRVRLLLPARSDVAVVQYASQRHYDRLLRWGVEIYSWEPSVLHAKTAVVDDSWSTIGSANLDSLSFNWNLEANFVINCSETGAALATQFEADLNDATQVELDMWRKRPWWRRCFEFAASLLSPIL